MIIESFNVNEEIGCGFWSVNIVDEYSHLTARMWKWKKLSVRYRRVLRSPAEITLKAGVPIPHFWEWSSNTYSILFSGEVLSASPQSLSSPGWCQYWVSLKWRKSLLAQDYPSFCIECWKFHVSGNPSVQGKPGWLVSPLSQGGPQLCDVMRGPELPVGPDWSWSPSKTHPYERGHRSLSPSQPWEVTGRRWQSLSQEGTFHHTSYLLSLILDFLASRNGRNRCPLRRRHPVYCIFVIAAQTN